MAASVVAVSSHVVGMGPKSPHVIDVTLQSLTSELSASGATCEVFTSAHEVIGHIVHRGRRTHMAQMRPFILDRSARQLMVIGLKGTTKIVIPLHKLMLLRMKSEDEKSPKLEVVWMEGRLLVSVDGEEAGLVKWYKELQSERIAALQLEEAKVKDVPKYMKHHTAVATATSENVVSARKSDPGSGRRSGKGIRSVFSFGSA